MCNADAELAERVARAIDQVGDVSPGEPPARGEVRGRRAPALDEVAVDEPGGGVELGGKKRGGVHAALQDRQCAGRSDAAPSRMAATATFSRSSR
jgi:hypothetical protein